MYAYIYGWDIMLYVQVHAVEEGRGNACVYSYAI